MDAKRISAASRRLFLKKALTAGAVVWSAPVVVSHPAGRAWAQTYPEKGRPHVPDGREHPHEPDGRGRTQQPKEEPRGQLPPNVPR